MDTDGEYWGDGDGAILWNLLDMLPLVVQKIVSDGCLEVMIAPKWPAQLRFTRLGALTSLME